jgi:hypothetical protein
LSLSYIAKSLKSVAGVPTDVEVRIPSFLFKVALIDPYLLCSDAEQATCKIRDWNDSRQSSQAHLVYMSESKK